MSDTFNRRDVLRYSTATATGLSLLSGKTLALEANDQRSEIEPDSHELAYDLSVINNSKSERTVEVIFFPKSPTDPTFTTTYSLQGLNDPAVKMSSTTRFRKSLDISGSGTYEVRVRLPTGATDSTTVGVTEDGISRAEAVTIYVTPEEEIEVNTVIR